MLPEEKRIVERMLSEGKINEEEAESLIKTLKGEDNHSAKKNAHPEKNKTQAVGKTAQSERNFQSMGNIIKKFFQNGEDIYDQGDKYKVIRNLSGEFTGETSQEVNIFAKNGNIVIKEQQEPGYKIKVVLMVRAETQEEAEKKVEEQDFVRINEKKMDIDCRGFQGVNLGLYLSSNNLYKLKSEIHNGTYYIEKNQYEELELETQNGKITAIDIDTVSAKIKTNNGKVAYRGCGEIDICTRNGKIDIELKEKEGTRTAINLLTRNGKCEVRIPVGSLSYLDCQTDNGGINLAIDNLKYIENRKAGPGKHIIAERMSGDREEGINCKVETRNGQIDLIEV